jgi:hypothetical protein
MDQAQTRRYTGATEADRLGAFNADAAMAAQAGWFQASQTTEAPPWGEPVLVVTYTQRAPGSLGDAATQHYAPPAMPSPPAFTAHLAPPPPGAATAWAPMAVAPSGPERSGRHLVRPLALAGGAMLIAGALIQGAAGAGSPVHALLGFVASIGIALLFAAGGLFAWNRQGLSRNARVGWVCLAALFTVAGISAAFGQFGATAAAPAPIVVTSHTDGQTVTQARVTIRGSSAANVQIVHDIAMASDDHATADANGAWAMVVALTPGENRLVFRVGDDRETEITFRLLYAAPVAATAPPTASPTAISLASATPTASAPPTVIPAATESPVVTPEPTIAPTPSPTPQPTAKPTPKPAPIVYAKLSARAWQLLVKAPDKYVGKTYQVWACISQFDAATGDDTFRAQASNAKQDYWYSNGDNALFSGDAAALSSYVTNDLVLMYVTSLGSYSYETQIGGSTMVPLFLVDRIWRKGGC